MLDWLENDRLKTNGMSLFHNQTFDEFDKDDDAILFGVRVATEQKLRFSGFRGARTPFDTMRANPIECRAAQHYTIVSEFSGRPWTDELPVAFLEDTTQRLWNLSVPTLIYNGAADHPEFMVMADRITALIPNARRSIVANAGGFPAWEQPDRTNKLVADFISAHQPPTNES